MPWNGTVLYGIKVGLDIISHHDNTANGIGQDKMYYKMEWKTI